MIFRGKEQVQTQQIALVLSALATSLFASEYAHERIQNERYVEARLTKMFLFINLHRCQSMHA